MRSVSVSVMQVILIVMTSFGVVVVAVVMTPMISVVALFVVMIVVTIPVVILLMILLMIVARMAFTVIVPISVVLLMMIAPVFIALVIDLLMGREFNELGGMIFGQRMWGRDKNSRKQAKCANRPQRVIISHGYFSNRVTG